MWTQWSLAALEKSLSEKSPPHKNKMGSSAKPKIPPPSEIGIGGLKRTEC